MRFVEVLEQMMIVRLIGLFIARLINRGGYYEGYCLCVRFGGVCYFLWVFFGIEGCVIRHFQRANGALEVDS